MSDTTVPPPRTGRSLWRRVVTIVLALFLLALLVRTGVDLWAGYRIRRVTAQLEQRHGSLAAGTRAGASVPPGENRARAMRAAATLMGGGHEVTSKISPFLAQHGPVRVPPDLRTFVEGNRAALQVAHEGRGRGLTNWEADYVTGRNGPALLEIRTLSNALYLAARIELEADEADAAALHLATGLALSSSLRHEEAVITQLIRCAVGLQQLEGVQRLLMQSEPSEASLAELARWLAEERTPEPMHVGLLGELKLASQSPFWTERIGWFGGPLMRLVSADTLARIGNLLEIQTGPRPRPAAPDDPRSWSPLKRLEDVPVAGLERAMDSGDLFSSARGVTELAVALRRYRLDRGQYPDALSALVPAYVASVPIDPLTGVPPVYAREGSGFRVRAEKPRKLSGAPAAVLEWIVPK